MKLLALLVLGSLSLGAAKEEPKAPSVLPYLGPGADKLSAAEYERVYRSYIQSSVLLGYPVGREQAPACEQALNAIFRQMGMFKYPVPGEAQQIVRSTKMIKGRKVETYQLGGALLQLVRTERIEAPDRLVIVNSSSPRATRMLSQIARKDVLELQKDPKTGLERLKGVPVGYPHPLLTKEGQGLFVKVLKFNGKIDGCEPVEFFDNSWADGFDLSEARCLELQSDAEKVWREQMSTEDFYAREVKRLKDQARNSAVKAGAKEDEAKKMVEEHLVPPLTSEINIVGSAMRNLAQCNMVALGRAGGSPVRGSQDTPAGDAKGTGAGAGKGTGSAQ